MTTPVCIQNNLLVELDKKFQDEIITQGGLALFKDTTFNPEWNVTVSGKVASIPKKLTVGDGKVQSFWPDRVRIFPNIKVGDEIIFSYMVVMNRVLSDNAGDIFTKDNPISPYTVTWSNPNGLQIVRTYLMNNKYECALVDSNTKICFDLVEGDYSDVEEFMGKYMPTENHSFNYKNLLPYEGKDYWMVDYCNAIAIKKNNMYEMVGDFVLLQPIREPFRGTYEGSLEIYNIEQDTDYRAIAKVISIGEPLLGQAKLSVQPNDTIVTDIRYVEKYHIDGNDYWVVRQKYIYGKSVIHDTTRNP